jgi:hypothetical protein
MTEKVGQRRVASFEEVLLSDVLTYKAIINRTTLGGEFNEGFCV